MVGCAINRQGVNGLEGGISDERDLLAASGGKEEGEDPQMLHALLEELRRGLCNPASPLCILREEARGKLIYGGEAL